MGRSPTARSSRSSDRIPGRLLLLSTLGRKSGYSKKLNQTESSKKNKIQIPRIHSDQNENFKELDSSGLNLNHDQLPEKVKEIEKPTHLLVLAKS